MTRLEFETDILKRMEEIRNLYLKYNPKGKHLSLYFTESYMSCNNSYWEEDKELPVDCSKYFGNEKCPPYTKVGGVVEFCDELSQ